MRFEWIAIALGDVVWISVAFALGLISRSVGLPPLVGFLATGFLLNAYGIVSGEVLEKLSDLGITLLLFTVGLKLNLRTLAKPQVWAVTSLHMLIVVMVLGLAIYALAVAGVPFLSGLDIYQAALIAFALSFSSTVYVVKVLEDRGEMTSLHGRIAIGILIVQDIAAVIFLAFSDGKWPSPWALLVLLIFLVQPILYRLLGRVGHGELLVLYGLMLALGGAEVFQLVGLKGDLGALVAGLMIAGHHKSDEMAKTMLGFKDLFLLGFFLSIGLAGKITTEIFVLGMLIAPLVFLKSALFFILLTKFNLRARTSMRASVNLTNYSEFGLIVAAVSVANGWLESYWLIVLATALSLSFAIAAIINMFTPQLYAQNRPFWRRFQSSHLIDEDNLHDIGSATIVVVGMGGIGTGTYDTLQSAHGETVVA
ncbi:MAG: cation:proton antiporter, partial [Methyloligellaceae bacterium]